MPRLASLIRTPDEKLVRTFEYVSQSHINIDLLVTLEYTTPETLAEMQERRKTRIIGTRRWAEIDNLAERAAAMDRLWHETLTSCVKKVEGMTQGKLKALIGLKNIVLDATQEQLDAPMPLDPSDTTALPEGELEKDRPEMKTLGDAATVDIYTLISKCHRFRKWVEDVISDVGFFQDPNLDERRKNS